MGSLKRMAVLCGFTVLFAATAQAEDWQVAKDEDGIKVSLSEIAGSKYKAYRGVTVINAPVPKSSHFRKTWPVPVPGFTSASRRSCSNRRRQELDLYSVQGPVPGDRP